jgi:flagellar hook-associated protein 2
MATTGINANSAAGSGALSTDVYNRVQQTLASQNSGVSKLNATLTRDQTKLSGLGQLHSALSTFQTLAQSLAGGGLSTSASSSGKGVLSATTTGDAKTATYAVDVKQLAQGQFLISDQFASSASALGANGGAGATVKIDFGTAGDKGFVAKAGAAKSITIDASNNSLDGIAAALKAAGVDASVVKGEGGYALKIAGQTGADNSLRISISGDAALKDLLAYNPDGVQKLKQTQSAQDALLTVDGKDVKSASNTLSKVIDGASLTLAGKGKTDVTITRDASKISSNLKSFVSAYNDLNAKLQALQKGNLKSDVALGQVSSQLSMIIKTAGGASLAALNNAGLSLEGGGNLKLDDKKLQAALALDGNAVGNLFTNNGKGLADQLASKAASFTANNSVISREAATVNKELVSVNAKRAALSKALTAQASALAALYTQQAQTGSGSALGGAAGAGSSLFDLLA